jgi:hypothetical protein
MGAVKGTKPMRKIEALMNKAIQSEKDWKSGNTEVQTHSDIIKVYLHGNLITEIDQTFLTLYDGGGWRSSTTKSRLNAILHNHGNGEGIYQKNHQWFVSTTAGDFPFFSGFRLD